MFHSDKYSLLSGTKNILCSLKEDRGQISGPSFLSRGFNQIQSREEDFKEDSQDTALSLLFFQAHLQLGSRNRIGGTNPICLLNAYRVFFESFGIPSLRFSLFSSFYVFFGLPLPCCD